MNITQLPDLCLISLFDRLPLIDLLNINLVCRRFAEIQQAVCLKKHSLKIVDLKMANFWLDSLNLYQISEHDYDLVVQYEFTQKIKATENTRLSSSSKCLIFNSKTCNSLIAKLPNIKQLTLANYSKSLLIDAHLVEMLTAWSSSLTHLKLFGYMNWGTIEPYVNLLTSLQYFSSWISLAKLYKLTICHQLTEFNCKYSKNWDISRGDWEEIDLTQTLSSLVGRNITQFGLQIPYKDDFKAFPLPVIQKLTRLSIKLDNFEDLDFITTNWKSIKFLSLEFTNKNSEKAGTNILQEILTRLIRLQYLDQLQLDIINKFNRTQQQQSNFNLAVTNFTNIPAVLWCKSIQFFFPLDPHALSQIELLFPNAKSLSFRVLSCDQLGEILCHEESCQNCGHIEALLQQYNRLLARRQINSYIIDFTFKFGKIICHTVRFG